MTGLTSETQLVQSRLDDMGNLLSFRRDVGVYVANQRFMSQDTHRCKHIDRYSLESAMEISGDSCSTIEIIFGLFLQYHLYCVCANHVTAEVIGSREILMAWHIE